MKKLKFHPQLFRLTTEDSTGNIFTWDLLTIDGENPRETVYFMHKQDSPSFNCADQIEEAIENENWEVRQIDEDILEDYSIDISIFDTAGDAYSEIKEFLFSKIGN